MVAQVHVAHAQSSCHAIQLLGSEILVVGTGARAMASPAVSQGQRARLSSVVRLLETAGHNLPRGDNEAYRCVAKAAALLQAECDLDSANPPAAKRRDFLPTWKMTRVMNFIDVNLDRPIRIEKLAAIAKLSCSHFSRAFHATAGETPSRFVIRRRVERAEQLILHTDKPLSEIALDCGMADQSHLTKQFRRFYGMAPGKWRKLQQGSETVTAEYERIEVPELVTSLQSAIAKRGGQALAAAY